MLFALLWVIAVFREEGDYDSRGIMLFGAFVEWVVEFVFLLLAFARNG